jgi:threonine aldolase
MPKRLQEDHANARLLAEALSHIEGVEVDPETVETNIVIFRLTAQLTDGELVARLRSRGVLASSVGPQLVRLVTHRDVSRGDCIRATEILTEEIEAASVVA